MPRYGRPEVALTWLDGDWSGRESEQRRLLDRAYSALGAHEKLVEIRRRSFEATGSRDDLRAWLEILPEPERVEATRYARERVVRADPTTAAESLLEAGRCGRSRRHHRRAPNRGRRWRLLAVGLSRRGVCRARRAARGHGGLSRAPGKHFDRGQARAYAHGARYLQSLDRLTRSIEDYGPLPQHEAFMTALRARHGRKTSFWREVDALRQPRR